jgi:tetratricopeptide (TPR) repeat protein
LLAVVLVALALSFYAGLPGLGFLGFDDDAYVTDNLALQRGLTWQTVRWALASTAAANWHPLTWLSHALDVQLFGLAPAGHHVVSLLWHLLNTVLVFRLLAAMTGNAGPSFWVAALFAVHPLHVESVAWISERKNLVSTAFGLLAVGAYVRHARRPTVARHLAVTACLLASLLAKPMLVTLPLLLLLLDYWPLGRLAARGRLLLEKAPWLLLGLASGIVTLVAQQAGGALSSFESMALVHRLENAALSYVRYLVHTVWPVGLSPFYPHAPSIPLWRPLLAVVGLLSVTAICLRAARRFPFLIVGWLWYLVSLVPVIGIVQVGAQAMADRYAYVPLLGIFVMLAWGARAWVLEHPRLRAPVHAVAIVVVLALGLRTSNQVALWRDTVTLFTHALRVTAGNAFAHDALAAALVDLGRLDQAIAHSEEAVRLSPGFGRAYNHLARARAERGELEAAIALYRQALERMPAGVETAIVHYNLANALFRAESWSEAEVHYAEAIRLRPGYFQAHVNCGMLLRRQGRFEEAARQFQRALEISPEAGVLKRMGALRREQGRLDEAARWYREALERNPGDAEAREALAELAP